MVRFSNLVPISITLILLSYNPHFAKQEWVWATSLSLATTQEITFVFFSYGYLDVSVPHVRYEIPLQGIRLSHSDISGLSCICHSPELFAAYHVLHSLCMPRHPPYALPYLLSFLISFPYLSKNVGFISLVEYNGIEPLTSCLQGRRSSQLS